MTKYSDMAVAEFVRRAASGDSTPGGGGVAALAGALGAAMASMAANFTVGRPKYAEHEEAMREALAGLEPLIEAMRRAVDDDAEAFSGISAAYGLPRDGDEAKAARKLAIDAALTASMRVPLRVAADCAKAAGRLPELARVGNANLLSDVEVAGIMLEAAARAARVNVLVNSRSLDSEEARKAEREAEEAERKAGDLAAEARRIVAERSGKR